MYHQVLGNVLRAHVESYSGPRVIPVAPGFSVDSEERAAVIVRKGWRAAGIRGEWTKKDLAAGKIWFSIGRFTGDEMELLNRDPGLALLPSMQNPHVGECTGDIVGIVPS